MKTRLIASIFLLALAGAVVTAQGQAQSGGVQAQAVNQPLRVSAERKGLFIGAAVVRSTLMYDPVYEEVLRREFNMLVAENDFKWDAIHPGRGQYRFTDADALVAFAEANGMKVRGHTLVWHSQLPAWLTGGNFTREEAIAILYDHITTLMTRYKGRVAAWDVVNEAVDDVTGSLRTNSFWYQKIGPDYIRMAFEFARAADPAAKLYYNDYANEGLNFKSNAVYLLLSSLKAGGVPVDGIGWQMHVVNGFHITDEHCQNAERLAALGLEVSITELDVRATLPMSPADLQTQATTYREIAEFCLAQPNCKALLTWGVTDKYSWIPAVFPGMGGALLYDADYQPKPAYDAVQQALQPGLDSSPRITRLEKQGKKLLVIGENFADGASIYVNGIKQKKVSNDPGSPTTTLVAGKLGRVVRSGDHVQAENPDGSLSNEFTVPQQ